jgi:hypothetical protein
MISSATAIAVTSTTSTSSSNNERVVVVAAGRAVGRVAHVEIVAIAISLHVVHVVIVEERGPTKIIVRFFRIEFVGGNSDEASTRRGGLHRT